MGPRPFEPAGDRITVHTAPVRALPAEALLFERSRLGFRSDVFVGVRRTMVLSEGVPARDQRDRLFVVHRHSGEGLADVDRGFERIRFGVGAFGIDVDQTHLDGGQRVLEVTLTGVAFVAEPFLLRTPVDVLIGLPDVFPSAGEAKGLEPHLLESDVAGEDHQVGPGKLATVLLLDRPQQPACLVEVRIIGPAVERGEALLPRAATAAAVTDPVGAGRVPGHADHQRAVVPVIGRPPVLRRCQQLGDVLLDGVEVEALELGCVVERVAHRVGFDRVLGEDLQVEAVGPPSPVASTLARMRGTVMHDRATGFVFVHLADYGIGTVRHGIPFGMGLRRVDQKS